MAYFMSFCKRLVMCLSTNTWESKAQLGIRPDCLQQSCILAAMNLSDWLAIIGVIMSTLMSLISIAVALHIFKKEQKDQQVDKDFLEWLLDRLIELVRDVIKELGQMISRQPKPHETRKPSPTPPPPPEEPRYHAEPQKEKEQKPPGETRKIDQASLSRGNPDVHGGIEFGAAIDTPPENFVNDTPRIRHARALYQDPDSPGRDGPGINLS
jgi:hypothetical protein